MQVHFEEKMYFSYILTNFRKKMWFHCSMGRSIFLILVSKDTYMLLGKSQSLKKNRLSFQSYAPKATR